MEHATNGAPGLGARTLLGTLLATTMMSHDACLDAIRWLASRTRHVDMVQWCLGLGVSDSLPREAVDRFDRYQSVTWETLKNKLVSYSASLDSPFKEQNILPSIWFIYGHMVRWFLQKDK